MNPNSVSIEELRRQHYNARVADLNRIHDDLMILRVERDAGPLPFLAGQYVVLGLGAWESRVAGCQDEDPAPEPPARLIERAYSIGCRLLDPSHRLLRATEDEQLEFVISLIRRTESRPPALTPRLFGLNIGDRLFVGDHARGEYGIEPVRPDQNVVFAATGTGEAPHNAMLAELLWRNHSGRIVSATCARYRRDLAYLQQHRELERQYSNYRYLTLTTREPENLDRQRPDYVGKRYLQDFFDSGDFERAAGLTLDPATTHVFLCGAPEMIGVPLRTHDSSRVYPVPRGMVEILEQRGFQIDRPRQPGHIHFEKYW